MRKVFRPFLNYKQDSLYLNNVSILDFAQKKQTPFYLYFLDNVKENYLNFEQNIKNYTDNYLICYAMKANSHHTIANCLASLGSGADVVSIGELDKAIEAGIPSSKIIFSGVGKTDHELEQVIKLVEPIKSINVESIEELFEINQIASKLNKVANVSFRLNPRVETKTHQYISTGNSTHKFGILYEDIIKYLPLSAHQLNHIKLVGVSIHIGSQLTCLKATEAAIIKLCSLAKACGRLDFIDVGGGLGIDYHASETSQLASVAEYMQLVFSTIKKYYIDSTQHHIQVLFEPGRIIVGKSGVLVSKVIRIKNSENHQFAIIDAGMNDLIRPALYQAYHEVLAVKKSDQINTYHVVGPICETSDCFGNERELYRINKNDYIVIADVGAYGFSMASNYNSRPLISEYFI